MASKTATAPEYTEALDDDDDFVEVKGQDFAPTHDFDETPELVGIYKSFRLIARKDGSGDSTMHTFQTVDGDIDAWGSAILSSRLEGLEGSKVKIVKTGRKLSTKSGRKAWEWKVLVSRSAVRRMTNATAAAAGSDA